MEAPLRERPARPLATWKQIADYLGVSERTAQLWERTRGLPVRRVRAGTKGSVYALPEEIDEWLRGAGAGLKKQLPGRRRRLLQAAVMAAAALAGMLLAVLWPKLHLLRAEPAAARFENGVMVAYDAEGHELWRRRPEPPEELPGAELDPERSKIVLGDFNGDGYREILALESFHTSSPGFRATVWKDLLSLTGRAGRRLWRRPPECGLLDAEGRPFTKDWDVHAVASARVGPGERAWVAMVHRNRFPGVVAEVLPDGTLKMLFANHGHVNSLTALKAKGKLWLVAGGATNALKGAFLALLDPSKGLSKAPEGGPARYRMANRAEADPAVYYHIPALDLTLATLSDVNHVYSIETGPQAVVARMNVGAAEGCAFYLEFEPPLEPRLARGTAACGLVHQQLERRGVLDHPFEQCPYFQQPLELRRWRPGKGWTTLRVPVATMKNTL